MTGPWPHYAGEPLSFIAQLDLAEMRAAGGPAWLPEQGRLLFFYLVDGGGWGFDPEDAGSFLVRHEIDPAAPADYPANLAEDLRFPALPLTFVAAESLPDSESLDLGADELSGKEERALEDALSKMTPPEPAHQVGGYASPIQGDHMALECQLVTNGLNVGSPKGYQAQEVEGLRAGAADWRLLLQVDTDNEAGMMWGDMGRIYFWIREQDARGADFAKAWMILQCY